MDHVKVKGIEPQGGERGPVSDEVHLEEVQGGGGSGTFIRVLQEMSNIMKCCTAPFLDSAQNRGEVIIRAEYHLKSELGGTRSAT